MAQVSFEGQRHSQGAGRRPQGDRRGGCIGVEEFIIAEIGDFYFRGMYRHIIGQIG